MCAFFSNGGQTNPPTSRLPPKRVFGQWSRSFAATANGYSTDSKHCVFDLLLEKTYGLTSGPFGQHALNCRAIVNCSFGTSPSVRIHSRHCSTPDKSRGIPPAFSHTHPGWLCSFVLAFNLGFWP